MSQGSPIKNISRKERLKYKKVNPSGEEDLSSPKKVRFQKVSSCVNIENKSRQNIFNDVNKRIDHFRAKINSVYSPCVTVGDQLSSRKYKTSVLDLYEGVGNTNEGVKRRKSNVLKSWVDADPNEGKSYAWFSNYLTLLSVAYVSRLPQHPKSNKAGRKKLSMLK